MVLPHEGKWIPALEFGSIDADYPSKFNLDDREIALCRVDDDVFAVGNICSHADARLSDGHIEGYEVFCPLHMGSFDVRTGGAVASPCWEPIRSYETKVEDGVVYVWSVPRPLIG